MMDPRTLHELIEMEIRQKWEEGYDVTGIKEQLKRVPLSREALLTFYHKLEKLKMRSDFPYREPNELEEIKKLRPRGPRKLEFKLDEKRLLKAILGGWIGRCAGCMLGKPVEGWPRAKIKEVLVKTRAYPLTYYFPPEAIGKDSELAAGNIKIVIRDDDLDYTMLNLSVAESKGIKFSTLDVAKAWLSKLPYHAIYTAERVAYRNLVLGLKPPKTATFLNPYREWIGARIRADLWGYICPGYPELAAELAFRDARLSHVKNGIYGEMLTSAMIAAAFTSDDPEEILKVGLSEIPHDCRLAKALREVIEWWHRGITWEEALELAERRYGSYHPVHTINNTVIVAISLLWGEGNFERSITIAVMGGWDTDCNGATVGSIVGIMNGIDHIPSKWYHPFNDRISSIMVDFNNVRISELAKRTLKVARRVHEN